MSPELSLSAIIHLLCCVESKLQSAGRSSDIYHRPAFVPKVLATFTKCMLMRCATILTLIWPLFRQNLILNPLKYLMCNICARFSTSPIRRWQKGMNGIDVLRSWGIRRCATGRTPSPKNESPRRGFKPTHEGEKIDLCPGSSIALGPARQHQLFGHPKAAK